MRKQLIFEQGYQKYYKIRLPNNVVGNTNVNAEALFEFIGKYRPYRDRGEIGSAYKQIRIKTDKALNLTAMDGVLRTSKREVASVLTYYKCLTNIEHFNELYVKIPYKIVYIFNAIKELVDEILSEGYSIPLTLTPLIGLTYQLAFYKNHKDAYDAADPNTMICEAQRELKNDFERIDSPFMQKFK